MFRYLDNIFPELFVPGESIAKGEVSKFGFIVVIRLGHSTTLLLRLCILLKRSLTQSWQVKGTASYYLAFY